jgi:hypothetical protein
MSSKKSEKFRREQRIALKKQIWDCEVEIYYNMRTKNAWLVKQEE